MAKGQVTEKDLESSIASLGGLSGLATTGASGAKRDSPFGSSFAKRASSQVADAPEEGAAEREPVKAIEVKSWGETSPELAKAIPSEAKDVVEGRSRVPLRSELKPKARLVQEPEATRKSDTCSERVTLQMSPDMRDDVGEIARKLQRRKADKKSERITANTVMRVAIQFLLDELILDEEDRPSTEEELLRLARQKLG